jgi:hypothetical protein
MTGPTRRTLRTNLRFIVRSVVPWPAPADAALLRQQAKAPVYPCGDRQFLALAAAQFRNARRLRAPSLVCVGASAGLTDSLPGHSACRQLYHAWNSPIPGQVPGRPNVGRTRIPWREPPVPEHAGRVERLFVITSASAEPSEVVGERALPHQCELAVGACQRCVQLRLPADVFREGSRLHHHDRVELKSTCLLRVIEANPKSILRADELFSSRLPLAKLAEFLPTRTNAEPGRSRSTDPAPAWPRRARAELGECGISRQARSSGSARLILAGSVPWPSTTAEACS